MLVYYIIPLLQCVYACNFSQWTNGFDGLRSLDALRAHINDVTWINTSFGPLTLNPMSTTSMWWNMDHCPSSLLYHLKAFKEQSYLKI